MTFTKKRKKRKCWCDGWCHVRSHLLCVHVLNNHTLVSVLSCLQQTAIVTMPLIVSKRMNRGRRKCEGGQWQQVSFLYLVFMLTAFPTESEYNDSKGLMISATLHARLPPIKPGDKQRSNAKPPVTNKVVYIHENITFINMMVAVIWKSFICGDLLVGGLDENRRLKLDTPFTLEYSIPHNTAFKDIELASESDWEMFVDKMKAMAKGTGKLTIKEKVLWITSHSLTKLISL